MTPRSLPHIFSRVFNTPLAIPPARLSPLLSGLRAASLQRGSARSDRAADPEPAEPVTLDDTDWQRGGGYAVSAQGVAWLPVRGVLVKRAGEVAADSTEFESYARVASNLRLCLGDTRVRAVMLELDTPGGEVGGLFDLAADIRAARTIKPVWAIANDDALSAGYAIASAADRVWITGVGGAGSIGVVAMHCDQSGFDAANGLDFTYIYAGARKVDGNPHEKLSKPATKAIQAEVDRNYRMFVDLVANQRGLDPDFVSGTQAAIYFGPDAVANGLVDQLGSFTEAVGELGDFVAAPRRIGIMDEIEPAASTATTVITATADDLPTPGTVAEALEAAPATATVVRLDAVRDAAATVRRESAEVAALCNIAGMPELATTFISSATPLHAVRADLQRRKAAASEARVIETVTTAPPSADGPGKPSEMSTILAERWARQMGRQ